MDKYVLKNSNNNYYFVSIDGRIKMQCDCIKEARVFKSYNDAIDFNFDFLNGEYEYIKLES